MVILVVSHDMDFIAKVATRILVFNNGKLLADGSPKEILPNLQFMADNALKSPEITKLLHDTHQQFPELPQSILSIQQLEEWFACH